MFEVIIPYIKNRLERHHELYSGQCKAEYLEENFSHALLEAGMGSDWKPDFNHSVGTDQSTNCGIKISNKSGSIESGHISISGSRLTKHKTLDKKIKFLKDNKEDYILCLATDKNEWKKGIKKYYFITIDSIKLDYHNQKWDDLIGKKTKELAGWHCTSEHYYAKIVRSMSDQLWTKVNLNICDEIYEIVID